MLIQNLEGCAVPADAPLGQSDSESESSIMQVAAANLTLKTKACRTLLDTWLEWRGSRIQPDHADIDPLPLKYVLSRIGVLEVRSRDVAIYRVAGTAFRDTIGFDPTGKNAMELVEGDSRARRAYRLNELVLRPCGYRSEAIFSYSTGLTDMVESIGLPLRSERPEILGFIIFTLESIEGRRWQNMTATSRINTYPETFEFLDIGAGVCTEIYPPPGYLDRT